jgi:hypothetical protein
MRRLNHHEMEEIRPPVVRCTQRPVP